MWIVKQIVSRTPKSGWRGFFLIGCVVLLALLLAGTSWSAWRSSIERAAADERQYNTIEVLLATGRLRAAALQQIRGGRGYLLTGNPLFLEPHALGRQEAETAQVQLAELVGNDSEQQARVEALAIHLAHLDAVSGSMIDSMGKGESRNALATMRSGSDRDAIEAILRTLDAIEGAERAALDTQTAIARQSAIANERYQYLLAIAGLGLLVLSILATIYVRRALDAEYAARKQLKHFASTDPLTSLPNRRAFMEAASQHIRQSLGDPERKLSLAIFDIDHFKRINDRFGHPVGDEVIKEVGQRAIAALRKHDFVGRIGGEEYGVLLPRTDLQTARTVCERLREAIAGSPIVRNDAIISFTASIGITELCRDDDVDHLLARADSALYDAKTGGRNQVRVAA